MYVYANSILIYILKCLNSDFAETYFDDSTIL